MSLGDTDLFFGDQSPLRDAEHFGGPAYEPRPEQFMMAHRVARALEAGDQICIEAPTGIGKTFAYLVPALYHSRATGKPVVISTHTINLQEQILRKDVPLLAKLFGREIRCRIAKGRSNYLCQCRVNQLVRQSSPPLPGSWLAQLLKWSDTTATGDREEFPPAASNQGYWSEVACDSMNCQGPLCPHCRRDCYHTIARRALAEAEIIVANHAFLFNALSREGEASPLPEFSALILDEGHTIPEIAAAQLGIHPNTWELRRRLAHLSRESRAGGVLDGAEAADAREKIESFSSALTLLQPRLAEQIRQLGGSLLRLREPSPQSDGFSAPISQLADTLWRLSKSLEVTQPERAATLKSNSEELNELARQLSLFFRMEAPGWAYWLELRGRTESEVAFEAVPVDPAPLLRKLLRPEGDAPPPLVITSATLAVNGSMEYFLNRIGLPEAQTMLLTSPFDFQKQVTLHLPPMPAPNAPEYEEALERELRHYLDLTQGRAFVLFTNHSQMRRMAERLEDFFEDGDYRLLLQGAALSPRQMLEEFRHASRAVIFGTDSFWTGVDVPGDALSNVIITHLPFAQIGHPLQQAREEQCRANGLNPFATYLLPEAVLKFRQGFGRLIRTRQDTGIIVVLDGRIRQKSYGKIFLNSIPTCRDGLSYRQ